jgi:tetratricopeptide (TPR) repeat protein
MRRLFPLWLVLPVVLVLGACESAEERAEEHYQNALELVESGDFQRAIVELRNVFQLVPNHLEARHELARILKDERGRTQQAYSQYLRLVEQYPDDVKARTELAELAFFAGNFDEMDRHGTRAVELAPDEPRIRAIGIAIAYRKAVEAEDLETRNALIAEANGLLTPSDPNRLVQEIILDWHLRRFEFRDALGMLNTLTQTYPDVSRYWGQRLQVLIELGDDPAVEAQLIDLIDRFPDDPEQKQLLIRYYLSRDELGKTEAFLRDLVAMAPEGDDTARIDLIRFLMEYGEEGGAREEVQVALDTVQSDVSAFVIIGAILDFSNGRAEDAIDALEDAIAAAEPEESTDDMKVVLAEILLSEDNEVGARALVEQVLQDNPNQTAALKMNAVWLIAADDTDGAIAALRTALDNNPDDAEALTLMANAYQRTGSIDLARDYLSLAVEASGNSPAETVRYVRLLIEEERFLPAEDVLLSAIRIAPNDLTLLRTAGQLYLAWDDDGRLRQVIDTLRRLDTPEAAGAAVELEAERLTRASGLDEAVAYLESLAAGADADLSAQIMLLRTRLLAGDAEGAVDLAETVVASQPDAPQFKVILATALTAAGELDRAVAIYDELIEAFPEQASLYGQKARVLGRKGEPDTARQVIDAAVAQIPDSPELQWALASYAEQDGDIDRAIEIYEALYDRNSADLVVANNLASLLATYRDDPESLERAWTIARRFRDAQLPALQDTFGWILHRREQSVDALPYLQSAAAGLPDDVIVQFHLAEVLFALERYEEALAQYRSVLDRAGVGDTRRQLRVASERITEIEASLAAVAE